MASSSRNKGLSTSSSTAASSTSSPTVIRAAAVARVQTVLSAVAFASAFAIGCSLHYKKIVKNGVAGYPKEWLPSVSATIGDWFPERNIFQIAIALTAAPRFVILALLYHLNRSSGLLIVGIIRTISCGGWVYITSSDHGLAHDVLMIGYLVLNIPWMLGNIKFARGNDIKRRRTGVAVAFFATLVPLVYCYIQHKVHRIPGAYSYYAIFEWALIIFDVVFDSIAERELREADTHIVIGTSSGLVQGTDQDSVIAQKAVKVSSDTTLKGTRDTALSPPTTFESSAPGASRPKHCRAGASFIADLYLSYVFWSIFTALIPSLFYFSVWELGVAGQELALLSLLSPLFLSFSPLFLPVPSMASILSTRNGQVVAYLLQFSALLAYLSPKPITRLAIVTFSCVIMMQREVILLTGLVSGEGKSSGKGTAYWGILTTLGFIVSSLSKHANHGNNPIWPFIDPKNGGYNELGLGLALMALAEFATRPSSPTPTASAPSKSAKSPVPATTKQGSRFWTASVPLGSLIFSLHNLLADPSSLIAASWTGWENGKPRGPLPHLFGGITMVAMCFGALLGVWGVSRKRNPFVSFPWLALGCVGTFGMYMLRNWEGYGMSLVLVVVLTASTPGLFAKVFVAARGGSEDAQDGQIVPQEMSSKIATTFGGAFFIYILLNLASIFTAAYAFIPGGWVFRERTDAVLTAQMVCLAFAFDWTHCCGPKACSPASSPDGAPAAIANVAAPARKRAYATLVFIAVASLLTGFYRIPMVPIKPHKPGSRIVNAGIWTVHFGVNNVGHDSQRGIRDLVKDMELDIVGLLETDLHRTSFGHRDLTRIMVEELGFNVDIGPGPNEHTWGAVLLTKFPIINTTHHLLPSPGGELAPAIESVLDIYGTLVTVVVSHNGQEEDPLDRELQSTELARIMKASPYPVIFLGYVVTKPHALRPNPYQIMVEDGNVYDIDDTDTDRWCEYVLYRGLYRTAFVRVSRGIITDTEMQIGQFVIPPHGTVLAKTDHDDRDARYIRAKKEEMPKDHWFPDEYHGNWKKPGKNKHYYHVSKTPLYYRLPENL